MNVTPTMRFEAFFLGYALFQSLIGPEVERAAALESARIRLEALGISLSVPIADLMWPQNDGGFELQIVLQEILTQIRNRYDEAMASHFKLPVNVFVALAQAPNSDFETIEKPLGDLPIQPDLREEFHVLRRQLEKRMTVREDAVPLLNWIQKVYASLRISSGKARQ